MAKVEDAHARIMSAITEESANMTDEEMMEFREGLISELLPIDTVGLDTEDEDDGA